MFKKLLTRLEANRLSSYLKYLEQQIIELHTQINNEFSAFSDSKIKNSLDKINCLLRSLNNKINTANYRDIILKKKYPNIVPVPGYSFILMYAAKFNYYTIVEYLLYKTSVNVNAQYPDGNACGCNALVYASHQGHFEIVKLLLEKGVDLRSPVRSMQCFGYRAYHYTYTCAGAGLIEAYQKNYLAIVKFLLIKNGMESNLPYDRLFDIAIRYKNISTLLNDNISPPITQYAINLLENCKDTHPLKLNRKKFIEGWKKNASAIACLTLQQGKRDKSSIISLLPQHILDHIYFFMFRDRLEPVTLRTNKLRYNFITNVSTFKMSMFAKRILSERISSPHSLDTALSKKIVPSKK